MTKHSTKKVQIFIYYISQERTNAGFLLGPNPRFRFGTSSGRSPSSLRRLRFLFPLTFLHHHTLLLLSSSSRWLWIFSDRCWLLWWVYRLSGLGQVSELFCVFFTNQGGFTLLHCRGSVFGEFNISRLLGSGEKLMR